MGLYLGQLFKAYLKLFGQAGLFCRIGHHVLEAEVREYSRYEYDCWCPGGLRSEQSAYETKGQEADLLGVSPIL